MPRITYEGAVYECGTGQTVLDCLTAQGIAIPSSCRTGVCQSCLMRVLEGSVPEVAQAGLKPTLVAQGFFKACSCLPTENVSVVLPDAEGMRQTAQVVSIEPLNPDIVAVRLRPAQPLDYRAGQFIRLFRDAQQSRCYSLASVPQLEQDILEIHVRHIPGGWVSSWVHQELRAGDVVEIADSAGQCFYVTGQPEQPLLLMGTGSGLAPLYGIVRDALSQGHRGPVWLYHGSSSPAGIYRATELCTLVEAYPNFHYVPCISVGMAPAGMRQGAVLEVALADHPDFTSWRVFLCGHPDFVSQGKLQVFLAGAASAEIHADPFVPSGAPSPATPQP
ncbi:MAG: 2Fe-2S iron-sulfur cluster binding domain-containing protein [Ferrovum sp.]|nr:2Fe-2S iron-sulfur cluster binding domain-containing protein [Ferrovum sp.]